jgi:hypothetical protein
MGPSARQSDNRGKAINPTDATETSVEGNCKIAGDQHRDTEAIERGVS